MDLEKIVSYLKNYKIAIPVALLVGFLLGWFVMGWGIWPVQWYDAAPENLHPDYQADWLRMAIYTSTMSGNYGRASSAWSALGGNADEALALVSSNPDYLTKDQISFFGTMVGEEVAEEIEESVTEEAPIVEETAPVEEEEARKGPNWFLIGGLCLAGLVVVAGVFYLFVVRPQAPRETSPEILNGYEPLEEDEVAFEEDEMRYVPPVKERVEPEYRQEPVDPVAQFMTTYMVGDDLYDDAFSIDAATGEFLGECGVGISETVGIGEPKRVAALEVWLFDKNDIQTVTKVIMSEHAFDDDKIRMRLESKGEPILAEPGKQILLETATLQLETRIVDMEFGEGAAPDRSFFQRITFELSVYPKG
jgi:hypothetical protein